MTNPSNCWNKYSRDNQLKSTNSLPAYLFFLDEEGDWYWPFGMGTVKLLRIGDETFKFPYFEKDKLFYEMYDKIGPYDSNRTEEINLVNYHKEEPTEKKRRWRSNKKNTDLDGEMCEEQNEEIKEEIK